MPMTIFYSWQMDTPIQENKKYIENCLKAAIAGLESEEISFKLANRHVDGNGNLDEANEEDEAILAPQITLTSDTKGVMGTPEIASVILEKISTCDVFIADVTLTGRSKFGDKQFPNANVGAEYGYAAGKLGFEKILLVMNEAYGNADSLPFDFRNRRFPVCYSSEKKSEKDRLKFVRELQRILAQYLQIYRDEHKPVLDLDWDVTSMGTGDFGLKFGIRNNGDRPATNMAIRFFNSDSFDYRFLSRMDPYGTSWYTIEEDSGMNSAIVRIHQDRPIHGNSTDWAVRYGGVVFSLRPVGTGFRELKFNYEILSETGRTQNICSISTLAFATKGRIPQLGFTP